ncbi:MAG: response regulator transcription factor [Acidobacteriaceae bacterium]
MDNPSPLVLCVDDEAVGLRVRQILLERAGYQVLTASDGHSGLELFTAHPVDAVVLDYSMPGMHGGQVAEKMRQTKPEVPILLLSAFLDLPPEVTSLADVYMTKGEGAPVLLDNLGNLLSSSSHLKRRTGLTTINGKN